METLILDDDGTDLDGGSNLGAGDASGQLVSPPHLANVIVIGSDSDTEAQHNVKPGGGQANADNGGPTPASHLPPRPATAPPKLASSAAAKDGLPAAAVLIAGRALEFVEDEGDIVAAVELRRLARAPRYFDPDAGVETSTKRCFNCGQVRCVLRGRGGAYYLMPLLECKGGYMHRIGKHVCPLPAANVVRMPLKRTHTCAHADGPLCRAVHQRCPQAPLLPVRPIWARRSQLP